MARLEPAQRSLLDALCQAARAQDQSSRQPFRAISTMGGSAIHHPALPGGEISDYYPGDLEDLITLDLLRERSRAGINEVITFDVSPEGFAEHDAPSGNDQILALVLTREERSQLEQLIQDLEASNVEDQFTDPDDLSEYLAERDTLAAQQRSSRPKRAIVRASASHLLDLVKTTSATVAGMALSKFLGLI